MKMINITVHDLDVERSSTGFNVMFKEPAGSMGINGCPMGRGQTLVSAIADLKRRTEIESPIIININPVTE